MDNTAFFFFTALAHQRSTETMTEGIEVMVRRYYENYTDATNLEPDFLHALEVIARETQLTADIEEIVREAEKKINAEGGIESSFGEGRHTVCTFPEEDK